MRVGVIHNPRSHRNRKTPPTSLGPDVIQASPATPEALKTVLSQMASAGVDLLVVDGGDGTVRNVLTQGRSAFGGHLPLLAVIPHGKTNALALDLGIPASWSVEAAIRSAQDPERRTVRPVLDVVREGQTSTSMTGFVFGAGAYVEATRMASRAHRVGVIDSLAVGVALVGAVVASLLGGGLARGQPMRLDEEEVARNRFVILASTLERFPLRLRPFGPVRAGLKLLDVDAPPRRLAVALPAILSGRESTWLERAGYRRRLVDMVSLSGLAGFVLDGETYAGGDIQVRKGADIVFVTP